MRISSAPKAVYELLLVACCLFGLIACGDDEPPIVERAGKTMQTTKQNIEKSSQLRTKASMQVSLAGKEYSMASVKPCVIKSPMFIVHGQERTENHNPGLILLVGHAGKNDPLGHIGLRLIHEGKEYISVGPATISGKTLSWSGFFEPHGSGTTKAKQGMSGAFTAQCP